MPRHLSDAMIVDAVEGGGAAAAQEHVVSCSQCARKVADARSTLEGVRGTVVPEPPEEYFAALRREIGRRIDSEAPGRMGWERWLWLPALALGGAMALVLALGHVERAGAPAPTLPAWTAVPANEDLAMTALSGLGPSPEDVPYATGDAGLADEVAALSEEESVALVQALRAEMRSGAL
jgi:hypothetical protein